MSTTTHAPIADLAPIARTSSGSQLADGLLLVSPGLIWGASFLFIAEGLTAIGPVGVAFVRVAVGLLTLLALPAARRPLPRAAWPAVIVLGVVWFAVPLSLLPFAEQRVSSALTGMLNGAVPLFAALVGIGLHRRLPSRRMVLALGVGLGGAVLIAWPALSEGRNSAGGVALIVGALVSYGIAIHLARPLQQRHGSLPVICRALAVATVLTAPVGLADLAVARFTAPSLASLLALGSLGTGVAFVLLSTAAGRLGATRASATAFVIPPVALLLGVLVRGEQVAPLAIFGAAISVLGVWLVRGAQAH